MHYRNGREARPGDKVLCLPAGGQPLFGMLHSLNAEASTCNGRLAVTSSNDPYVTLSECLHVDDVAKAFPKP